MFLLKELPTPYSLSKFAERYSEADIQAISDFVTLLRACSDISDGLDRYLGLHGLMQGRWWVLVLLMREDSLTSTPSDLAKKVGVTKATMTGFIDNLVREALVMRLPDHQDGRKSMIQLTPKGQQKLDEIMPEFNAKIHHLMNKLPQDARRIMMSSVQTLATAIS